MSSALERATGDFGDFDRRHLVDLFNEGTQIPWFLVTEAVLTGCGCHARLKVLRIPYVQLVAQRLLRFVVDVLNLPRGGPSIPAYTVLSAGIHFESS